MAFGQRKNAGRMVGRDMATCTNFHHSFAQPFSRLLMIHWKKRVSRKAAKAQKEEWNKSREPILCVSAPLREILLCVPEVICRRALRHSQRGTAMIPVIPDFSLPGFWLAVPARLWQSCIVQHNSVDPAPASQDRTRRSRRRREAPWWNQSPQRRRITFDVSSKEFCCQCRN